MNPGMLFILNRDITNKLKHKETAPKIPPKIPPKNPPKNPNQKFSEYYPNAFC